MDAEITSYVIPGLSIVTLGCHWFSMWKLRSNITTGELPIKDVNTAKRTLGTIMIIQILMSLVILVYIFIKDKPKDTGTNLGFVIPLIIFFLISVGTVFVSWFIAPPKTNANTATTGGFDTNSNL
jgi:hypothetical protein